MDTRDRFDREDLAELLATRDAPCVSIYLPTARFGAEAQQGAAQLRKLRREAEGRLAAAGLAPAAAAEILAPAAALAADPLFWQHQADGLALFLASGFARRFRLELGFAPRLEVGERFVLRPLLPLLMAAGRYYVLALSIKQVRLLEASRDGVRRLDLTGVPASMEEALGYDVYDTDVQLHTASPAALGRRPGIVHGHGGGDEEGFKDDVVNYFRRVAQGLAPRLADPRAPLVLACVEAHAPLFREASRDPRLVPEVVAGNPELAADEELARRAWPLAEPRLLAEVEEELERHRRLLGSGRALSDVATILPAAAAGRVQTLFVAPEAQAWGAADPLSGSVVRVQAERGAGDEDLVELAAVRTLERGGAVYTLEAERLPGGQAVAATLRY